MALIGSVTGSVNLGGASTFISSSNGSSVEIGASTQVLIMSGGGATSTNPRNFADVNFFVSGVGGSINTTTRGSSLFGGDVKISGSLMLNGDPAVPSGVGQLFYNGQTVYLYNNYTINPAIQISAVGGQNLLQFEARASTVYLGPLSAVGRVRLGTRTSAPTALAHITASNGSAGYAPLKFDSGSLLATPEAGTIEYDATSFYLTTGSTRQSILTTNNAASIGTDAFFFVSGTQLQKGTAGAKTSVFGGDVVVSGALHGGLSSFTSNTLLNVNASNIVLYGGSVQQEATRSDISVFVSGSTGSKGGANKGTAVFGGDVVVSGTLYNSAGVAYSTGGGSAATGTFNDVSSGLVTTASVSFAGTQGAAYFASRSIGSSTGGDVFFYVSGTARSGHSPAQGFLAKRTLFNGDVVTSGTLQMVGAGFTSTIGSDTLLFVSGGTGTKGVATSRGTSVFAGDLHISGNTFLGTVAEAMATTGSALTGTLTFNTAGQSVFYVSGTAGNITANFTNVPVFDGRVVSTNVILSQSSLGGGIVSAVQINSVASTILWANGVTPTANAGKHDVFGFSLIRSGTVWTTLGQMSTYG